MADGVYGWLRDFGLVGRTEREVRLALEHEMRVLGADDPSFPSIVAAAENGALPHATARDVPIPAGTLVTLDLGCRLHGYCSDCTRTWATGELPDDLAELYAVVLEAQEAALAAVRPGPEGHEVDAVAREIIAAAGHGEHFGHGLGHGVGLDVHEGPRLSQTGRDALVPGNVVTVEPGAGCAAVDGVAREIIAAAGHGDDFGHGLGHGVGLEVHEGPRLSRSALEPLVAGNVVTVEPGVYVPERGGVRIEDLVVVTDDGCDVLSAASKAPATVS